MSGRRSRLAPIAAIVGLAVAAGAAGCGSSSHTATSTSAPAITKTAFVTKANAICTHDNAHIAAAVAKLGKSPTKAQITAFAKSTFVPSVEAELNGIRALGAPSGDQKTVTNMLDLAKADLDARKSDSARLLGDPAQFANFADVAHPYGLTDCARNS
jgi:hypothetical protein